MNSEKRESLEKSPGNSRLASFATWIMNKVSPARANNEDSNVQMDSSKKSSIVQESPSKKLQETPKFRSKLKSPMKFSESKEN